MPSLMAIGTLQDVRNAVALLPAHFGAGRRLQSVDIIGTSSTSVNSVLVIKNPFARIQTIAVEGKQRWVRRALDKKGMSDSTISEQSPKSKESQNPVQPILRTGTELPCYESGHRSLPRKRTGIV